MTTDICDHTQDHEWYRKDVTVDGTTDYLRCNECGGEWQFDRDHTTQEALELLNKHLRVIGYELLRAVGLR